MADKGTLQEVRVTEPAERATPEPIDSVLHAKAKREAVRAALRDADEGSFVSQEAMGAWVSSWGTDAGLFRVSCGM